jgi:radical SAM protein with 4Fe4S-binding SPASM domain
VKARVMPRINLEGRTALETVIPLETPLIVFVDPSSACNFQCTYCPTGDRGLIKDTGRYQGRMSLSLFEKILSDIEEFRDPVKVLRLYKDGEPFLNRDFAAMIRLARQSSRVEYIDTTTNASLLTPDRSREVIDAGLDKINISIDGMTTEQYLSFTKFRMDMTELVDNVRWFYEHKDQCEVAIKIPSELITEDQRKEFYDTFGDICDRIFIENFAPCWPEFDVEERTGIVITKGIYDQPVGDTETCPYIFYSMSVNADGLVSSCFLDWGRKLIVGDARTEPLTSIWQSDAFNELRLMHLRGERRAHPVCGNCGQLSHCLPDNIDAHRPVLLERFEAQLNLLNG